MKVLKAIKDSLMWIWQFPQNILAVCLEGILCNAVTRGNKVKGNQIIWCDLFTDTMSLGNYLFVPTDSSKINIEHGCGHSRQSSILGPLYLIIIGIPSLIYNIVYRILNRKIIRWDYYSFYTEYWLMNKQK